MATKNNPGKYDCYANAEPDEPMFVLLARDDLAPSLVIIWAMIRDGAPWKLVEAQLAVAHEIAGAKPPMDQEKFREAVACAHSMVDWSKNHNNK